MGLVAPWHVGSSWTRAQTHVPCIGRRILNHCATREALLFPSCLIFPLWIHRNFHDIFWAYIQWPFNNCYYLQWGWKAGRLTNLSEIKAKKYSASLLLNLPFFCLSSVWILPNHSEYIMNLSMKNFSWFLLDKNGHQWRIREYGLLRK